MAATIKRSKQNDGGSDSEMYDDCPLVDEKKRAAMDSHCEIERRRRNKMVSLVNELSDIVPACNSYDKRKPDKLTILKLAVDHLRSLKGFPIENDSQDASNDNKSSFLTDSELKKLVLEATSGFLFVVICATGKVIYVSDTVAEVLGVSKDEWDDANMYNIIHPEDRSLLTRQLKVEEHELQHDNDNLTQASSGLEANLASDLCRRSFIMKMKTSKRREEDKEVVVTGEDGTKYVVVHVTGYIRHWPTAPEHFSQPCFNSQSCLVAIGQCKQKFLCDEPSPTNKQDSFLARHKMSGMFSFVDGRVTSVLGYKTADLLQRSIYEFCHESDQYLIEEAFKQVLDKKDQVVNATFRFLNSSNNFTSLRLSCSAFLNPFSDVVEYISATYTTFAAHPCSQTPKFNKNNNFEMNNNHQHLTNSNNNNQQHLTNNNSNNQHHNNNKQQNSFLNNQSIPPPHVSSECGSYSQTFGAVVEPSMNSCNIQKPQQQIQLSQNQPLLKHHLQQSQHHQQPQPQQHHQQQLQHHLQQPQHQPQQPQQQPQHHQHQSQHHQQQPQQLQHHLQQPQHQPQHHQSQQQSQHNQQQPQHHLQQPQQQLQHHLQQPQQQSQHHQHQPQHHQQQPQHQQLMTSSTQGFNLVPSQSSLPLYDQNTRWLNHQINEKFERNSNAPPPNYDQHLNLFQQPEPGNYQHLESGINNLEYHWTSRLANQMPVVESETFVDAGNFMNNSTGDATTWHASNYPYDYDMWSNDDDNINNNDEEEDMSEVMNILTSSSSSNLFNSADESLIKKFCS